MSVNVNLMQKMVEYVEIADAVATQMKKTAAEKEAKDKAVNDLIPTVVDALKDNGCFPEANDKVLAKCASLLRDPIHALEILANTAKLVGQVKQASVIGSQHTQKKASVVRGSLNSPYAGVRTTEERDSDRVLFERLGLR